MAFPNEHLSYYLDCIGILLCGYPLSEYEDTFCYSLRFGTFGPPSNEPSAYLMSTLGMVEIGEKASLVRYAHSVKSPNREDRPFFRYIDYGAWGLLMGNDLGTILYRAFDEEQTEREGIFACTVGSSITEGCRAIGREALNRYLAFLYLHQESDAWSHGEAFGLWLGRVKGRAEMRERAAKAAEDEENGGEQLPEFPYLRRDIAERIRALEVWR